MRPSPPAESDHLEVEIDGRRIGLSHLAKPMYEDGTTKAQVIDYATRVAAVLLPHLAGRPVTRKRWVDGVRRAPGHDGFFAKQLERGAPAWIRTRDLRQAEHLVHYPIADDAATLVWFAQSDALELHVPQWRFGDQGPLNPDRIVLDLDPGSGFGLVECALVARLARGRMQESGLDPIPVTTGSHGIHLYASADGRRSADDITDLAHDVALALHTDHPDLVVTGSAKAHRAGHVFIDWSQNRAGKTTVSPYSLRGTRVPSVAAPRTWRELASPALRHLGPEEVLHRLDERGDLLAPLLRSRAGSDGRRVTG